MTDEQEKGKLSEATRNLKAAAADAQPETLEERQKRREASRQKRGGQPIADTPLPSGGLTSEPPAPEPPTAVTPPSTIAEHKVVSGDTLSGLAQKYYGSQARDYWMGIYEANKETIGDNPSLIRVGQVLQIPKL